MNLTNVLNGIYATFTGNLITSVGVDSKELLQTAAQYAADAKKSLVAIGEAALANENPMSWAEFKLKMIEEGKIAEAAFLSVEQLLATDLQSFVNDQLYSFEGLLISELSKLQPTERKHTLS